MKCYSSEEITAQIIHNQVIILEYIQEKRIAYCDEKYGKGTGQEAVIVNMMQHDIDRSEDMRLFLDERAWR